MGTHGHDGNHPVTALKDLAWPTRRSRCWFIGLLALVLSSHAVHLPLLLGIAGPGQVLATSLHTAPGPAVSSRAGALASPPRDLPSRHATSQDGARADEASVSKWCLFEAICAAGRSFPTPVFAVVVGLALPAFFTTLHRVTSLSLAGALSGRRRRAWLQVYLN